MALRVDNLPWPLRPVIFLSGLASGLVLLLAWGLLRLTVRVRHVDPPSDLDRAVYVECAWHEWLLPYFVARMPYRGRWVWMNHPAWYMKGVHLFLRWMGVQKLALGSSGHGGRAALAALVPEVAAGANTFLNPDGPHGPAHAVKDGALDLAASAQVPILALRFACTRELRLPTWDRKRVPLPFSRLDVFYTRLDTVAEGEREVARARLAALLG